MHFFKSWEEFFCLHYTCKFLKSNKIFLSPVFFFLKKDILFDFYCLLITKNYFFENLSSLMFLNFLHDELSFSALCEGPLKGFTPTGTKTLHGMQNYVTINCPSPSTSWYFISVASSSNTNPLML